jgi:hypothetical protein
MIDALSYSTNVMFFNLHQSSIDFLRFSFVKLCILLSIRLCMVLLPWLGLFFYVMCKNEAVRHQAASSPVAGPGLATSIY